MSKMMAPSMEVVRFKEADVIVASGAGYDNRSMNLSGFGDGVLNTGYIRFNGDRFGTSEVEINRLDSILSANEIGDGRTAKIYHGTEFMCYIGSLADEYEDDYFDNFDGDCYWDDQLLRFIKQ